MRHKKGVIADYKLGLELEVFAGLGLYPTYVVMQGFSTNDSVVLLAVLNVYVIRLAPAYFLRNH
jgi:hypothetical protein